GRVRPAVALATDRAELELDRAALELDPCRAPVGRTSLPQDGTADSGGAPGAPGHAEDDTDCLSTGDGGREHIAGSNVDATSARLTASRIGSPLPRSD